MNNFTVDLNTVQTNMVYVDCKMPASELVASLAELGIDLFDTGANTVRIVTHLHITDEDVQRIISAFAAL
jgi:threonine aldolase